MSRVSFNQVFITFIRLLGVKITSTTIQKVLELHPEPDTLLAYSDLLDYFHIPNYSFEVSYNSASKIPTPFLAYLTINKPLITVVRSISKNQVIYLDEDFSWHTESHREFKKKWSGIVLVTEKIVRQKEDKYYKKRFDEIIEKYRVYILFLFSLGILCALILAKGRPQWIQFILFAIKLIGLIATIIIFKYSNFVTSVADKRPFCTINKNFDCNSILSSNASRVFFGISWSDLGLFYFSSSFIVLLLSYSSTKDFLSYIYLQEKVCVLLLLFAPYSIYYQWFKARKWCVLCLTVVLIFFIEATIVFTKFSTDSNYLHTSLLYHIVPGILIPVSFLLIIKSLIKKSESENNSIHSVLSTKNSSQVFISILNYQPLMPRMNHLSPIIKLGPANAINTLTVISNPLCKPCASIHDDLLWLLERQKKVNVEVIFMADPERENSATSFVLKLYSLPESKRMEAIEAWYTKASMNINKWNDLYSDYSVNPISREILQDHVEWIKKNNISRTPTIYLNGRLLPEEWGIKQLVFILGLEFNHLQTMDLQIT